MPGAFITNFLNTQFNSFSQRDISQTELCALRAFDPANWNPDYSNPLHREFYYLKYASAYITEYYLAYQRIFCQNFLQQDGDITVLSVGCGAMLDLVGFGYAHAQSQNYHEMCTYYYGVDILDWECAATRIQEEVESHYDGLGQFNISDCDHRIKIISFPKSISDIPYKDLINFANSIQDNDIMDKICVINSKRRNSYDDTNLATSFCDRIASRLGYTVRHEEFNISDTEVCFENLLHNKFIFDDAIIHHIRNICMRCIFGNCERYSSCCDIIQRYPMRYARNIKPEIYYLEKNNAMA